METPTLEDLKCLNIWPEGTVGYDGDKRLIETLYNLFQEFGFGRVPQVAEAMREIWYNRDKIAEYEKFRQEQVGRVLEYQRLRNTGYFDNPNI